MQEWLKEKFHEEREEGEGVMVVVGEEGEGEVEDMPVTTARKTHTCMSPHRTQQRKTQQYPPLEHSSTPYDFCWAASCIWKQVRPRQE